LEDKKIPLILKYKALIGFKNTGIECNFIFKLIWHLFYVIFIMGGWLFVGRLVGIFIKSDILFIVIILIFMIIDIAYVKLIPCKWKNKG
jgi:hypothetical protein